MADDQISTKDMWPGQGSISRPLDSQITNPMRSLLQKQAQLVEKKIKTGTLLTKDSPAGNLKNVTNVDFMFFRLPG